MRLSQKDQTKHNTLLRLGTQLVKSGFTNYLQYDQQYFKHFFLSQSLKFLKKILLPFVLVSCLM